MRVEGGGGGWMVSYIWKWSFQQGKSFESVKNNKKKKIGKFQIIRITFNVQ